MDDPKPSWNDTRIEQIIGNLLRAGVLISAVVVALGAFVRLGKHGPDNAERYRRFHPVEEKYRRPVEIVRAMLKREEGQGRALIQFGLLLLIATPVARVIFSAFAFAREGDFTYVLITLFVLTVLLYSLLSGYVRLGV